MATQKSEMAGIHITDIAGESDDWHDVAPGIRMRVLRTCQSTGTWSVLYKVDAGTTAMRHRHLGSSESYIIKGKLIVEGGAEVEGGMTLHTGDYIAGPNNQRVHEATYFPEDTIQLYIHKGPIMYLDENDNVDFIIDWSTIHEFEKKAWEKAAAKTGEKVAA